MTQLNIEEAPTGELFKETHAVYVGFIAARKHAEELLRLGYTVAPSAQVLARAFLRFHRNAGDTSGFNNGGLTTDPAGAGNDPEAIVTRVCASFFRYEHIIRELMQSLRGCQEKLELAEMIRAFQDQTIKRLTADLDRLREGSEVRELKAKVAAMRIERDQAQDAVKACRAGIVGNVSAAEARALQIPATDLDAVGSWFDAYDGPQRPEDFQHLLVDFLRLYNLAERSKEAGDAAAETIETIEEALDDWRGAR